VLSSRVEGLVAELSEVVGKQDAYCVSQSRAEGSAMAAVREKMLATPWGDLWAQKQTMFSYGEEMSTDPLEAMFLKQLVFMAKPRRVLEIGMFVGYGSAAMLEGSSDTKVVSLEIDPYLKGWLAACLESYPGIAARHEVVVGPALDSIPKLQGKFDMVFVDANKAEYKRYVELILLHKLLAPTGVIVCDNVLYNGYPYAHQHFDAQPARREFGNAIRDFNQWVADHPDLEQVVLPVRDGISIIRLRDEASELFQFELNVGNHPCSWGVDYADCPTNPPWKGVVQCMADAGFAGTELGPLGYYDPASLSELLDKLDLRLTAGNIFEKLHEPQEVPKILEKVHAICKILKQHGAKFFVIVPHVAEERIPTTGRSWDAPRLSDAAWAQLMGAIKQVAEVCRSHGIMCTLHPHAGCWIEYEDEFERAMEDLPADLVGLCLDTGHFTYAGMDVVAKYKKHASRIPYMHFKDINGEVLAKLQREKRGFWDGIKEGVFCNLGQGLVDYPALLRAMKAHGYSSWVTVEQDFDNSIDDVQARLLTPFEACKLNLQYLRSVGVVRPGSSAPAFTPPPRPTKSIPGVKALHTFQRAPNHTVVDIFMREKGLEDAYFEQIEVWINLDMEDNRNAENLAMNPQGSIPWFVLEDGQVIAETIAMCEYIEDVMPENPLVGRDAAERAKVRMWQRRMEEHYCYPAFYGHRFWTSSEDCPADHFMRDFFTDRLNEHGGAKMIPSAWKEFTEWAKNRILWLERVKGEEATQTGRATQFIAGDFFSLVDIQVYTVLWFFAEAFPHPPQRILEELDGRVPWVQAWYERCHARPSCVAAREDREKDLRKNKTEPKKHLARLQAAAEPKGTKIVSELDEEPLVGA